MRGEYRCSLFVLILSISLTPTLAVAEVLRTVSVAGTGKSAAPPDMATVRTGVVSRAANAGGALEANSKAVRRVMDVLKRYKIAANDIQTSNFNVHPEYSRNQRGAQQQAVIGYQVSNQLTVRVRNLPILGEILDALVEAGSNQISGVTFGIDGPADVLNRARKLAMADARARAELYADAAGVDVGQVISISEQAASIPQPQPRFRAMAVAESAVPLATGEQEMAATVYVVYALKDRD